MKCCRRSSISKLACQLVSSLVESMGHGFEYSASYFLSEMIKILAISIQVQSLDLSEADTADANKQIASPYKQRTLHSLNEMQAATCLLQTVHVASRTLKMARWFLMLMQTSAATGHGRSCS